MDILLEAATYTHPGPRPTNQDAAAAGADPGFAAVADGMGGAAGGEIASVETLAAVRAVLLGALRRNNVPIETVLAAVTDAAQQRVCSRANSNPELLGMGSTLAVVAIAGRSYGVANVGDSRVYLVRTGNVIQLSHDHSRVQARVDRGEITPREARLQPDRNVITRAIGAPGNAAPHLSTGEPRPDDRFVVTSDGVHGVLDARDLQLVHPTEPAEDTASRLVQLALKRGTTDNATAAVLRVMPDVRPG